MARLTVSCEQEENHSFKVGAYADATRPNARYQHQKIDLGLDLSSWLKYNVGRASLKWPLRGLAIMQIRIRHRYSEDNDVTLFHGDCLKLLKKIPNDSAQLVVTSPPYNVGKVYEEKSQTLDEYLEFQKLVISECVRITRVGGSICWQVGHHKNGHSQVIPLDLLIHPLFTLYEKSDSLRLRNRIIWHFEHGLHCKYRFSGRYETILWYTKGDKYTFNLNDVRVPQKYPGKRAYKGPKRGEYSGNPLGKNPSDVWIFPNVKGNHIEKTKHPCQFPVELPERLILALSNPRDLVVDPFMGVGSTAVAAVLHNRKVAGADRVREYLETARGRIRQAAHGTLSYRPCTKPIYVLPPDTPLRTIPQEFLGYKKLLPTQGGEQS
jgi:adenine-specific DNA-methyltransferase